MNRRRIALTAALVLLLSAANAFSQTEAKIPRRIRATVSSIDGTMVTFLDGTISVDAARASIRDGDHTISIDSIRPGMQLVVLLAENKVNDGAGLSATLLSIERAPAGRLSGSVEWIDSLGHTFGLLGRTIDISSRTRFVRVDRAGESGRFEDLVPGVEVEASVTSSGTILSAEDVTIRDAADRTAAAIRGSVKSITGATWVITTGDGADKEVTVTADTTIVGTPEVGSRVEVFGYIESGRFIAVAILKARVRAVRPALRIFSGTVGSIGAESWTIRVGDKEIIVLVTSATAISGDPRVGDRVEVAAEPRSDGKLVALRIHKVTRPPLVIDELLIHGVVKTIGDDSWSIVTPRDAAVVLAIRADTRIVGDPHVGDTVEALARRDGDALIALAIFKVPSPPPLPPPPPPTDFMVLHGIVKTIAPSLWMITTRGGDLDLLVDERTKIAGDPQIGDEVEALATRTVEGLHAVAIYKIIAPPPPPPPPPLPPPYASFQGTVKTIGSSEWVITTKDRADVRVLVTPMTKIVGNPKVGDTVEVFGYRKDTGIFVAEGIANLDILPPPPPTDLVTIRGVVKSIEGSTWTVALFDTKLIVLVDPATVIVGTPIVGDRVEVTGRIDFERRLHAVKITKL